MQWDGKQMAALAAAADSGSFEQAAAQLRITLSAVSQRIRALEEAAGALFLLTCSRPCRPTEHGLRLLRYWRQVMSLQQELDNELQQQLRSWRWRPTTIRSIPGCCRSWPKRRPRSNCRSISRRKIRSTRAR